MSTKQQILQTLIEMSRWLGEEQRGLVILGEGNTSGKSGDDTFYIKASGAQLGNITEEGLVEVYASKALEMLDGPNLSDAEIKARLAAARVDEKAKFLPSIETIFHSYLLSLPGVNFIGHTHPISVNSILCSKEWRSVTEKRLTPDEIVCCGVVPAYIEYTDPGVQLGRKIRDVVCAYTDKHGVRPKSILMQNHGLIAIGETAKEVQSITAMWDKAAKVLAGTFHFGGPNFLSSESVYRINSRPDELSRKKMIEGR